MPKGLYFTAVVSFFGRLISEVTERITTEFGHIHLWLLFEKFGLKSFGIYLSRAGGKIPIFETQLWTLTEHISATEHNIDNWRENCQSTGLSYMPPNLVNFGPETAENGWWVFAYPPSKFSHWETLTALPHRRNRQQAIFGTCYVMARN